MEYYIVIKNDLELYIVIYMNFINIMYEKSCWGIGFFDNYLYKVLKCVIYIVWELYVIVKIGINVTE